MPGITDEELTALELVASQRRGGKPIRYLELAVHREAILKAMQRDIPLPVLLNWLRDNHGVTVVLNTLRKYIVKEVGRDIYDAYLRRNGWVRPPKRQQKSSFSAAASHTPQRPNSPMQIDRDKRGPAVYQRTERK